MTELLTKLDIAMEQFLLSIGMSADATNFVMLNVNVLEILLIGALGISVIAAYIWFILKAYFNMIYHKHEKLRRDWSIMFTLSLLGGLATIVLLLN